MLAILVLTLATLATGGTRSCGRHRRPCAVGLSRAAAYQLALETILGSAKLMAQSNAEAEELRNQVTSPNGTTFAGLKRMEARDFRGLIKETVLAAKTRSEELSKDN